MYDKKKLDELKGLLDKWEKTSLKKALAQYTPLPRIVW
jgi:hypothetical protein